MKKRIVSLLVAAVMTFSLCAVQVNAANYSWNVDGYIAAGGTSYTIETDAGIGGETGCVKLTDGSQIEYENLYCWVGQYKYMVVDAYYASATVQTFTPHVTMCKINDNWDMPELRDIDAVQAYPTNQWVKVVFDVTDFFDWAYANRSGQILQQIWLKLGSVSGDDAIYTKGQVKFDTYIEPPTVFTDDNGKYAYVSEDLSVTINEEKISAYGSIKDALTALGADGGIVYIDGTITKFEDIDSRGAVTIRGIGETEEDVKNNVLALPAGKPFIQISGGDAVLDYLTITGAGSVEDCGIYSTGAKITIGKNIKITGDNISISTSAPSGDGNMQYIQSGEVVIDGGKFYSVTPLTNWSTTLVNRVGSVKYTFNGGEFNVVAAGSLNSWEWERGAINGDVVYTFNGGTYHNNFSMGSALNQSLIDGNIIWTINGGTFDHKNIFAGNGNNASSGAGTIPEFADRRMNNAAVIVNLGTENYKQVQTLTLGTTDTKANRYITGDEIYILNNYEKNTGAKIVDGATADYKMYVYNGTATPVFKKDKSVYVGGETEYYGGDLKGFKLVPDVDGAVPYLNGIALTAGKNGLYTIEKSTDISNIVFVNDTLGATIVKEETVENNTKVYVEFYNFTGIQKDIMLYVAGYKDGELESVIAKKIDAQASNNVQTAESKSFQKQEDLTYKAFLWDGMYPLFDDISF